jgi:pimeloyl-ACP methyl ester carboxylesterase
MEIATKSVTAAALAIALGLPLPAHSAVAGRSIAPAQTFNVGTLKVERFGYLGLRSLIFIPALFCGSWQWNAQINKLFPDYDISVVTLPGFDGRPMVSGDALMKRAARDIHELIVTKSLYRPIIIGHSIGGTIAVYFAERYPGDVSNVIAVEGGYPEAPTQQGRDAAVAQDIKPFDGIPQSALGEALRRNMLQYTIQSKDDVATVERFASTSTPEAIVDWMRAALSLDLTPGLSSITVPFTEIIPFDKTIDPYVGYKTADAKLTTYTQWISAAPHWHVLLVGNARHFVMFDRPHAFAEALVQAMAQ